VEDIFSLKTRWERAMETIPGWGKRKVSNLLQNIEERRKKCDMGPNLMWFRNSYCG